MDFSFYYRFKHYYNPLTIRYLSDILLPIEHKHLQQQFFCHSEKDLKCF